MLLERHLTSSSQAWLITGVAGFIGSSLLETLLLHNQRVVGLDNFSTGLQRNLDEVRKVVSPAQWELFQFHEGDILDIDTCRRACNGVDLVLHQAALGSVPRSLKDPITTNASNVTGFLNMLVAAREAQVKRFVYAASSSTYGDHAGLPKKETVIGKPLSPYAVTKYVNELYADVFATCYNFSSIGLRYFNVFGPRQDPNGAYAAVIPKWIGSLLHGDAVYINGDGETSRDFCYIDNVVQANVLAALTKNASAVNQVYNIAVGESSTLNTLYSRIRAEVARRFPTLAAAPPVFRELRPGDVRHSLADISKAQHLLGYTPTHRLEQGLKEAIEWYIENLK